MPRIRYLKPEFFKDEKLAELSFAHRLLFQGLWILADREGRLEDRPKWIKIEIFPYDPKIEIEALLSDLHQSGFIFRYKIDGNYYIQIKNFFKHQKPHHTEKKSFIPVYPLLSLSSKDGEYQEEDGEPQGQDGKYPALMGNGEWGMGNGKENGELKGECEGKGIANAPAKKPAHRPKLTDQDWVDSLKANTAYRGIDVERELAKMDAWLQTPKGKKRQKTRGFVLNWLNRIDVPMPGASTAEDKWDQLAEKLGEKL